MPDEKARASLTRLRGQQAAQMPHAAAKQYVADSAKMDKSYEGVELQTDLTARKQQSQKVLGSFKQGGTVPKTGNYKLHKGEKVVPQESTSLYKKASDPKPFAGIVMTPMDQGQLETDHGAARQSEAARRTAHDTAVKAGGFEKHIEGSNGPHSQYHRQNRDGRK